jgi:GntP family gluconate:H+ symporter
MQHIRLCRLLPVQLSSRKYRRYLGTVILIGLITAIPAALAGYLWSIKVASKIEVEDDRNDLDYDYDEIVRSFGKMPSAFQSFLPIVLPIVLIELVRY